jgi:hypothetical protein
MNLTVNVGNRMVNHLMRVLTGKPVIGKQGVGVQGATRLYVLLDFGLKGFPRAVRNYLGPNFTAESKNSHNRSLIFTASAGDSTFALAQVHVPSLTADKGFIGFNLARKQPFKRSAMQSEPDAMI